MNPILRLLQILRPVRGWLLLGGLLSLATLLANVALMAVSGWFIAAMALAGVAGVSMNYFTPAAVIRACAIVRTVGRYGERLVTHEATLRLLSTLRVWFYLRLEPLAPAVLEHYRSGDLLSRLRADIDTLDHFYLRLLLPTVVALASTLVFVLFLLWFSPLLALIEAALLGLAGIALPLLLNRLATPTGQRLITLSSDLRANLVNDLQGMGELLIDGADARHAARIARLSQELAKAQSHISQLDGIAQGAVGLCANLAMWLLALTAIPMVHSAELPPAQLAMLALFALASFEAIAPLPAAFQGLGETLAAARRIFALVDSPPAVQEPSSPASLPQELTLEVRDLRFTYPATASTVLQGLNLRLPAGAKLALIGPSGSGKTTLLQLLLKFRSPDEGNLTLGGVPYSSIPGEDLRKHIAVATQYNHLFNASIRDNLQLANPEADQAALEDACRLAMIHDFIATQPEGYETRVGELGLRLSGGQIRRLAIARALLKEAPILILDEPTEGLDPHTEQLMMENILQWSEGRSLLLVTHRVRGLERMDQILLMHKGDIVERGSHHELLASSETYRRLCAQQQILDPADA
ncbi:MAG: thiol reductant ABC exporter subunit CydC [Chromatiales bacterium]|jgi:ATP-binding cassette subfamily C protein CydC